MNKKILIAILISIALPGSMLSAPADSLRLKSYKLDEVVVTGTRNETDIRHLPMTISVVGRRQLEQTYQPSILPTLTEQVPGLMGRYLGITYSFFFGILFVILQMVFCSWWLRHHKHGLFEGLWKRLTWIGKNK